MWIVFHWKTATYILGRLPLSFEDGKITTDVLSKDNHSCLPLSSCHPPAIFKELAQGIGTRLRIICSKEDDLDWRLEEYAG